MPSCKIEIVSSTSYSELPNTRRTRQNGAQRTSGSVRFAVCLQSFVSCLLDHRAVFPVIFKDARAAAISCPFVSMMLISSSGVRVSTTGALLGFTALRS